MTIFIPGKPEQQGSTKSFATKNGKIATTADNPKTKPWRAEIAACVLEQIGGKILYQRPTPVIVIAHFVMPRPASEPKHTRAHTRAPDLDKLCRAVGDALTGVLYDDDAQITSWGLSKRTAEPGEPTGLWLAWETALIRSLGA